MGQHQHGNSKHTEQHDRAMHLRYGCVYREHRRIRLADNRVSDTHDQLSDTRDEFPTRVYVYVGRC